LLETWGKGGVAVLRLTNLEGAVTPPAAYCVRKAVSVYAIVCSPPLVLLISERTGARRGFKTLRGLGPQERPRDVWTTSQISTISSIKSSTPNPTLVLGNPDAFHPDSKTLTLLLPSLSGPLR